MLTRVGPGSSGYNFSPEFMDWDCVVKIPPSTTFATGQAVARDVTQFPGTVGADRVVLPNDANAGAVYGVYQGPNIVNASATATMNVPILARQRGYGVVLAASVAAGVAVTVGANLITAATNASVLATAAAPGNTTYVGTVMATGANTAKGATIIAVPGSGQTNLIVNAYIVAT
jgi:hypothetical protein